MFDLPLHPIAVHFPIALGTIIPIIGIVLIWAINTNRLPNKTWSIMILLSVMYLSSAVGAIQLGEIDEELVERIVQESVIESHEEAGELMAWVSGILLFAFVLPVFFRNSNKYRVAAVVLSVAGLIPLVRAGHTGGELVYKHNAAKAHVEKVSQIGLEPGHLSNDDDEDDDDDDDDHHSHVSGEKQKLGLNDGKKWPTDHVLRENMTAIESFIKTHKEQIHLDKLSEKEYFELGSLIGASVDKIFKNCKLPPEADAQLHIILADILKAKESFLKKGEDHRKAVGILHDSLANYGKFFDQSEKD